MSRSLIASLMLGSMVVAACANNGVDKPATSTTKKLVDLDATEEGDLCDYTSDVEGGYGAMKTCADNVTVTVKSRVACIANIEGITSNCTATVGDAEACAEAVGTDLCKLLSEPKCAFALMCTGG